MEDNRLTTQTRTGTSVGTKLAVATLALFAANGLAFAAIPTATKMQFEKNYKTTEQQFTAVSPSKTACADSDGGINLYEAGTVSIKTTDYKARTKSASYTDTCSGDTLYEYSCSKDNQLQKTAHQPKDSMTTCEKSVFVTSSLPDLIVSNVEFDFENDRFNIYMQNIGEATMVPTVWYEQIFNLSWLDATGEQIGTYSLGRAFNDQEIAPGEEVLVYQHVPLVREGFEDARYLRIMADPDETIDESNEDNNPSEWRIPSSTIDVVEEDEHVLYLSQDSTFASPRLRPGGEIYMQLEVANPNSYEVLLNDVSLVVSLVYPMTTSTDGSPTISSSTPPITAILTEHDTATRLMNIEFTDLDHFGSGDRHVRYNWTMSLAEEEFEDVYISPYETKELDLALVIHSDYIYTDGSYTALEINASIPRWQNTRSGEFYTSETILPTHYQHNTAIRD